MIILILKCFLVSVSVFAGGGGELSGGRVVEVFKNMNPVEALTSQLFEKRYEKLFIPTIAGKVSAEKVCISSQQVVVNEEMEYCALWQVKLFRPESGENFAHFKYKHQAVAKANSRNGTRYFRCVEKTVGRPKMPIKESIPDCLKWSVSENREGRRLFNSYEEAVKFYNEIERRASEPLCEEWGQKSIQAPKDFHVVFLNEGDWIGVYNYHLPKCTRGRN